jgi:hypothetical protein
MYRPYTGVGARKTPNDVCERMTILASLLSEFTLRSGALMGRTQLSKEGLIIKKYSYLGNVLMKTLHLYLRFPKGLFTLLLKSIPTGSL